MDNLDKLLEAVEHPESFSSDELQHLISDPEMLQLYKVLCVTRAQSFASESENLTDEMIDAQWQRLKTANRKPFLLRWFATRKAAAVISLVIISCSIVAVGVSISLRQSEKNTSTSELAASIADDTTDNMVITSETVSLPKDTVIIFEDKRLNDVLTELAPYYGVTVELKRPQTKEVRLFLQWDSTTTIDELIEHLNSFDRINLTINENVITDY